MIPEDIEKITSELATLTGLLNRLKHKLEEFNRLPGPQGVNDSLCDDLEQGFCKRRHLQLLKTRIDFFRTELAQCGETCVKPIFTPPVLAQPHANVKHNRAFELATYLWLARQSTAPDGPNNNSKIGKLAADYEQEVIEYCLRYGHFAMPGPENEVLGEFGHLHKSFWQNYRREEITSGDMPASYYKSFFNLFFEGDLYGKFRSDDNIILSTGSFDQDEFALSWALKYCVEMALERNWVGYSHSLGRISAREAIRDLENARLGVTYFTTEHIALILGVTAGLSCLLRFLKEHYCPQDVEILTHLPGYASFITACESVAPTRYLDLSTDPEFRFSAEQLIARVTPRTGIILVLADLNPISCSIPPAELEKLADFCNQKGIFFIFDESGDRYPSDTRLCERMHSQYIIRMDSLSKKCSIPGMKLGHFVADPSLQQKFYEYASTHYGGPASFFYLLQEFDARFDTYMLKHIGYLTPQHLGEFDRAYDLTLDWLQVLYDEYKATRIYIENKIILHRNYALNVLRRHTPNLISKVLIPGTGINIFCKLNYPSDSYIFFRRLLKSKQVAVFPGVCSGKADGCWVRITISTRRQTLIEGLDRLIAFLKEEFVRNWYTANPVLKTILVDRGQYNKYPHLDFHTHVYDVYEKAVWLAQHLSTDLAAVVNDDLLRDAAFCHDAGKVIDVLVTRAWRVLRLKSMYNSGVPEKIMDRWRDVDILGYRDALKTGTGVSIEDILKSFPCLTKFRHLVTWDSAVPPRDRRFTASILSSVIPGLRGKAAQQHYELIRSVVEREISEIDITSPLQPVDIHALLLDLADKLADAEVYDHISSDRLLHLLDEKKRYVIWRYISQNEPIIEDANPLTKKIEQEFCCAQTCLSSYFKFS